jgi:hypothetical protein
MAYATFGTNGRLVKCSSPVAKRRPAAFTAASEPSPAGRSSDRDRAPRCRGVAHGAHLVVGAHQGSDRLAETLDCHVLHGRRMQLNHLWRHWLGSAFTGTAGRPGYRTLELSQKVLPRKVYPFIQS